VKIVHTWGWEKGLGIGFRETGRGGEGVTRRGSEEAMGRGSEEAMGRKEVGQKANQPYGTYVPMWFIFFSFNYLILVLN